MNAPSDTTEPSATRIGDRYVLEERIGVGAMGAVWRGTDELLNRPVAVKELLLAVSSGANNGDTLEEARRRLLREGRISARLQHAHVISMFDVVVHEDRPWLVMEYLPSQSLATVLSERGPLPPVDVAELGRQVADGLAAAHAAGVVHRDVKPGNVLLGDDGRVKLTDFGVSRAVDDVQVTRTGMIAGTPAYLAPETARGREPAAPADVFALGATLYAAVEGRPPFGLDENAYALLHKVATGVVDPPRQAGPLTAVLMRLLAAEPADRPTATQARDALAAVAAGAPPVFGRPPGATAMIERGAFARRGAPSSGSPSRSAGPPTVTGSPVTLGPTSRPRRRIVPMLWVLLGVLLVAGVAGVAVLMSGFRAGGSAAVAPAPSASAPSASAPRSTRPPPTALPPVTQPRSDIGPVEFVRSYYALLPENTDEAFALLGPQARQASGDRDGFERFWNGVGSVRLDNARLLGDNTVAAGVVFDEGRPEPYRFVVGTDDEGRTIITSFSRL